MIDLPNAIAAAWVLKLVLSLYLAIMISKPDVEDLNYFADALMFGASCVAGRVYDVSRKSRNS